jgi:hypothetical protein
LKRSGHQTTPATSSDLPYKYANCDVIIVMENLLSEVYNKIKNLNITVTLEPETR